MKPTATTAGAKVGSAWLVLLAAALAGCGGAAVTSATPPPPRDIQGALAQIDRAESDLDLLLARLAAHEPHTPIFAMKSSEL